MEWIKIDNVLDLPDKEGTYFVYSKVWFHPFYRIDVFCGRLSNAVSNGKPIYSHYQVINKPEPPKL